MYYVWGVILSFLLMKYVIFTLDNTLMLLANKTS